MVGTCGIRRRKSRGLTDCAIQWYESHALRSPDAQPLRFPRQARGAVTAASRVDDLDRSIIEALQENGRESFRRIASQLGVSEGTVRARYARLQSEGILQVVAVTNPLGLGFDQALIGVKTNGAPSVVADEISKWPEADYVVVTAGRYDIVVEVVAVDREELLDLTNRMRGLDGVVSTETFFYLEMWKQLYDWGTRK
jgi:Lrp/AsnC family transcriptional regulator for asnA, asnC and gidA